MNEETTKTLSMEDFSDSDLERMLPVVEKETERRREARKREAYEKMRAIAEGVGMTPEELLGIGARGGSRRRGGGRKGKRGKMLWQHPDDPTKEYRGGKKPDWLRELEAEGREALKVENL